MKERQKEMIYKIAVAYYRQGQTQQDIADRYRMSRIMVSRLLQRAVREKIIEIKINSPDQGVSELEQRIEGEFGLREVILVRQAVRKEASLTDIGSAAAAYLARIIRGGEVIGITWGKALLSLVNAMPMMHYPGIKVVQMLGGLGNPEAGYHGADLARRLAQSLDTKPWLIHSPGIVRTSAVCEELMHDMQVKDILDLAARADIALLGIGLLNENAALVKNEILARDEYETLAGQGAVGDISFRFFNRQGQYFKSVLDNRIVGISAEQLHKIPYKIGIAGGREKHEAVLAAVRGRLVDVLVTDYQTGKRIMEEG